MTFAVNYIGEPFNTPLLQNPMFAASVRWSAALFVALVIDVPRGERSPAQSVTWLFFRS